MPETYLLDTCIWRDFYEGRFSKKGKPLGEYATKLFMRILKSGAIIIFSEALIRELRRDYLEQDIYDMLSLLIINHSLIKIEIKKEEFLEAKQLSDNRDLPFVDCLNAVQARNHGAILVSQDRHFKRLSDVTEPFEPDEIN